MTKTNTTKEVKQPKSVRLSTYLQSMVIAILVTGVTTFIAAYFVTINVHGNIRASITNDMSAVSKVQQ